MKKESAFTFIEVLIALFILGLAATFAIPSWRDFQSHQNEKILQSHVVHLLQFARDVSQTTHQSISASIEDNAIIIKADDQLIKAETLKVTKATLKLRTYPWYRTSLRFQAWTRDESDNGMVLYCPVGKANPPWVVAVSKTGVVHVVMADREGVIRDSRKRVVRC